MLSLSRRRGPALTCCPGLRAAPTPPDLGGEDTILEYSTCVPPPSTSVQDFICVTAIYRVIVTVNYGSQKREWHEGSNDISDMSLGIGSSH